MKLDDILYLPSFSPFRAVSKRSIPNNFDRVAQSFDEKILGRIKELYPPSISLSWLSLAVDFLSSTHAEARNIIAELGSSDVAVALYLDNSIKLLDICNSISSEIGRLRQRRLLINFILHLLHFSGGDFQIPAAEKLRKARDSISDWENSSKCSAKRRGFQIHDPEVLIRDLASGLGRAPRGKTPSSEKLVLRIIYAVQLLTVCVAGVLASAICGVPELPAIRVTDSFSWADSFNKLRSATLDEFKNRRVGREDKTASFVEIDDVTEIMGVMRDAVDGVVFGNEEREKDNNERLRSAVKELGTATEKFSDGVDSLCDAVNGMFNTVLLTRNGMLEEYRVGQRELVFFNTKKKN